MNLQFCGFWSAAGCFGRVAIGWLATCFLLASPAKADGIIVGSFCIEGVTRTQVASSQTEVANGVWTRFVYSYDLPAGQTSNAKIVVFSKPIVVDDTVPPTCANAKRAASAQNAAIMLEGALRKLSLRLDRLSSLGTNSYVISPQDFVATIGKVTSGYSTIGGGTLDLAGSRAWIENPDQINIAGSGMRGPLRIESWDRTLKDAVFTTPKGDTFRQSLRASSNSNTIVDVDTATGIARLHRANMSTVNTLLADLDIEGEQASFTGVRLPVKSITLVATDGIVRVSVAGAAGTATGGTIGSSPMRATLGDTRLAWRQADTGAEVNESRVALGRWTFADLVAQSDTTLAKLSDTPVLSGKSKWTFESLANDAVRGEAEYLTPLIPVLDFAVPAGSMGTARLTFDGPAQAVAVKGQMLANQLNLAGAQFGAPVPLSFERRPGDPVVRIPLSVHIGNVSGTFGMKDDKQEYVFKAALKRVDLDGDLVIDVLDPAASRMEIQQNNLGFELANSVSVKPFAAGAKPSFAQVGVRGLNRQPLVVRAKDSTGVIELATPTLIVANPVIDIGKKGKPAPVEFNLTASGNGAVFGYNLASSKFNLVEGDFAIGNTRVHSSDPTFVADFGDTLVERPDFQMEGLAIRKKRGDTFGSVTGGQITLATGAIRSAANAGQGATYSGNLTSPFTIGSIEGSVDFGGDKLGLVDLSLRDVSFTIGGAKFDFGQGMGLRDASLRLSADRIRSISRQTDGTEPDNGTYVDSLRIRAGGKLRMGGQVHLVLAPTISDLDVTLNGNLERLNGSGSASVSAFGGTLETGIDTKFVCKSGNSLVVPVRATLATGGGSFGLAATDGEFESTASFAPTVVNVISTAMKDCEGTKQNFHVPAKWASTKGWCPTWRKPRRTCTWKTKISPEINIGYRIRARIVALQATMGMTNPRLAIKGGKTSFCNVGSVKLIAPTIIAGYTPQIDDNGVLVQAINAAIELTVVQVESALATGLVSGLALVVDDPFLNVIGSSVCLVRGSYEIS